ncbi:hypothetical protein Tco_0789244 [Tanacetum coccineum]
MMRDEDEGRVRKRREGISSADSAVVVPTDEPVFLPEQSLFTTTSTDITIGARNTVRPQAFISLLPEAKVERLRAMTTPSPSPPISLSPPSTGERLASYLARLCLSLLGSRYKIEESSTARPTKDLGVDYGFVSTIDTKARQQGISEVGYGIRDTWVDSAEAVPKIAPMTVGEVNTKVIMLVELYEHDIQDLYALLEDA